MFSTMGQQASTYIQQRKVHEAKSSIDTLARLNPTYPNLKQLKTKLAFAQRQEKKNQAIAHKIAALYGKADIYLSSGRARNADKIYAKIELLSPSDPGLNTLGPKIADAYMGLAEEANAKHWRDVYVWVDRGLNMFPPIKSF